MDERVLSFARRFDPTAMMWERHPHHGNQHNATAYIGDRPGLHIVVTGFDGRDTLTTYVYDHRMTLSATLAGMPDDDLLETLITHIIDHHQETQK